MELVLIGKIPINFSEKFTYKGKLWGKSDPGQFKD